MTQYKVQSEDYAKALAVILCERFEEIDLDGLEEPDGETPAVIDTETYADVGMLTRDAGVVVHLTGGAEVRLTIQAYVPRETVETPGPRERRSG